MKTMGDNDNDHLRPIPNGSVRQFRLRGSSCGHVRRGNEAPRGWLVLAAFSRDEKWVGRDAMCEKIAVQQDAVS